MREEDIPYRPTRPSEEFLISREALDEAYSALAGCLAVLGDMANIALGMEKLRTAQGARGDMYDGHNLQFTTTDSSDLGPYPGEDDAA